MCATTLTSKKCGTGYGLAACQALDLVATSDAHEDTVSLFSFFEDGVLRHVHTFDYGMTAPFGFGMMTRFPLVFVGAGALAFMPGTNWLLVCSHGYVHVLDPAALKPIGSMTIWHNAPWFFQPVGVAASHTMVATTCGHTKLEEVSMRRTTPGILLFQHAPTPDAPCTFVHTRSIEMHQCRWPVGVRFAHSGSKLLVSDSLGTLLGYEVDTGNQLCRLDVDSRRLRDLECLDPDLWTEGRWLVITAYPGGFLSLANSASCRAWRSRRMQCLAFMPRRKLLIVRHPDYIAVHDLAMALMSESRSAWMVLVCRAMSLP